jgi:hypothetical protein
MSTNPVDQHNGIGKLHADQELVVFRNGVPDDRRVESMPLQEPGQVPQAAGGKHLDHQRIRVATSGRLQ